MDDNLPPAPPLALNAQAVRDAAYHEMILARQAYQNALRRERRENDNQRNIDNQTNNIELTGGKSKRRKSRRNFKNKRKSRRR